MATVVGNDQLHVPFEFLVTVPSDAVRVTVSAATSAQVPVLVNVERTAPDTPVAVTVNCGARLVTA